MSRHQKKTNFRAIRTRREDAMQRPELRQPSTPRLPPDGPTSPPIKMIDPELRAMIDEAIKRGIGA